MPYSPVITTNGIPAVSVTMAGNVTYQEFLNSLSQWNYQVKELYIRATTNDQLSQSIKYNIYDTTGGQFNTVVTIEVDPYQYQSAQVIDLKDKGILLNGQSSLSFNLLPNETVKLVLYTNVVSVGGQNTLLDNFNMQGGYDLLKNLDLYNTTRVMPIRGLPPKC